MSDDFKSDLQKVSSDFCATSTAHGVQHLHLSTNGNQFHKLIFWSAVFFATIGGSSFHLYSLITAYLDYEYYETTTSDAKIRLQFPHVTICSHGPISIYFTKNHLTEIAPLYARTVPVKQYLVRANNYSSYSEANTYMYIHRLTTLEGIFANLPSKKKHISSLSVEELVISCTFAEQPCSYQNFTRYIHSQYMNCYTFKDNRSDLGNIKNKIGPQFGLSLILKGPERHQALKYYDVYSNTGNINGLRISIHEPGTLPNIQETGFEISAGVSTTIGLKQETFARLQTPKSSCQEEQWISTYSGAFKKTFNTCIQLCTLEFIKRKCSCITTKVPILQADVDYCLRINTSMNIEEVIERGVCEIQHSGKSDEDFEKCSEQCVWRCNEINYVPRAYVSSWPTEPSIHDFVQKYIISLDEEHPMRKYYQLIQNHYSGFSEARIWPTYQEFVSLILSTAAGNTFDQTFLSQVVEKLSLSVELDTKLQNFTTLLEAEEHWVKTTFYRLNIYWHDSSVQAHRQVGNI